LFDEDVSLPFIVNLTLDSKGCFPSTFKGANV